MLGALKLSTSTKGAADTRYLPTQKHRAITVGVVWHEKKTLTSSAMDCSDFGLTTAKTPHLLVTRAYCIQNTKTGVSRRAAGSTIKPYILQCAILTTGNETAEHPHTAGGLQGLPVSTQTTPVSATQTR